MESRLPLTMQTQPDSTTCGPTCLHSVYRYFGDTISLDDVIAQAPALESGGTLAVLLACHALQRGYDATIYTYNLQMFDPTWFSLPPSELPKKITAQMHAKRSPTMDHKSHAYIEFLRYGGKLFLHDLSANLLRSYLSKGIPILTGLSATFLYRCAREIQTTMDYDDVQGEITGHFVVLSGYDPKDNSVLVTDPLLPNPVSPTNVYSVDMERLLCSILLGILTHDANLLIIRPRAT